MHNTHFAIVSDVDNLEHDLTNFGDENNWYSLDRIIDLKNMNSEEKNYVEECLEELNKDTSSDEIQNIKNRINELLQVCNDNERHFYWQLGELYQRLYEKIGVNGLKYTIENILDGCINDYNSFKFDEFGITTCYDNADENIYFVEIDMHS